MSSETENDKPNTPKFPRDNNQQYLSIKNQIGCAVNELNGLVLLLMLVERLTYSTSSKCVP